MRANKMFKKIIFSGFMFVFPLSLYANSEIVDNSINATPNRDLLKGYDLKKILNESKVYQPSVTQMVKGMQKEISPDQLSKSLDIEGKENPDKDAKGIMVLVSLTMPNVALEQLLEQSNRYKIPLVIRGVLPSGFKATTFRINQLLTKGGKQDAMKSGVSINPNWFKQFNITQVPAFVSIKQGACSLDSICNEKDFDIVYGNISMENALDILSNGDAKENVDNILKGAF